MSAPSASSSSTSNWKTPDEVIRLQRLRKKTKALQSRIDRPPTTSSKLNNKVGSSNHSTDGQKRKFPFLAKNQDSKKPKQLSSDSSEFGSDSIFQLLSSVTSSTSSQEATRNPEPLTVSSHQPAATKSTQQQQPFSSFLIPADAPDDPEEEQKITPHLPIDWSLKTKLRLLTLTQITGNGLKTSQKASGITSFVRCLNPNTSTSEGLDISLGSRFHQATMFWQHPCLPWLKLFPRNARSNNAFVLGEAERAALATDFVDSFSELFQLVRALQCPYFYMCANNFNVLFRAAGIGGRSEIHAFITPTSRGMRAALKQEEIVYTLPLKQTAAASSTNTNANKSLDSGIETQSTSFSNLSDEATQDDSGQADKDGDDDDDDDIDQAEWLASMGVDAAEIKKINSVNSRLARNAECAEDFSDHSIALIEGVECQAFFTFLLNSKNTITRTGRLAGVPPTLLAPVAFPGGSLRKSVIRSSKQHLEGADYHRLELDGVVLPHVLPYICSVLSSTWETFSATMTGYDCTNVFSKVSQHLINDLSKETDDKVSSHVFGRENLSDCGMPQDILEAMCRCTTDAVHSLKRMCFNKLNGGYSWE